MDSNNYIKSWLILLVIEQLVNGAFAQEGLFDQIYIIMLDTF